MKKFDKNSPLSCIIVLLVISVACVGVLAVLNDALYVPPDMSVFSKALEGEYSGVEISDFDSKYGKIMLVAEGTAQSKDVVGVYSQGKKVGQADGFEACIIFDKETNEILASYEIKDGSTGGYSYDESKLNSTVGLSGVDTNFLAFDEILVTGTTNSSNAMQNALQTCVDYFSQVYAK